MAYIDLDEINRLHPKLTAKYPLSFANGISAAINEINRLPNADVVPKSEWDRIYTELDNLKRGTLPVLKTDLLMKSTMLADADMVIDRLTVELNAMRGAASSYKMHYEKAKTEVAREIFEELIDNATFIEYADGGKYLRYNAEFVAELKKKYTEGKP